MLNRMHIGVVLGAAALVARLDGLRAPTRPTFR